MDVFVMDRWLLLFCVLFVRIDGQDDVWSPQLNDLKTSMVAMSSTITLLEKRMSELNFLEYAFKVNNIDNHLGLIKESVISLGARMTRMESQTEEIKEILSNIQNTGPSCPEVQLDKRTTQTQSSNFQRAGGEQFSCNDLSRKIEDYGFKISKSQQELKDSGEQRQRGLINLLETVRNGFTKTFQKVDILPSTEMKLSQISSSISGLPPQLSQTLSRLSSISDRLSTVQSQITAVGQAVSNGTRKSNDRLSPSLIHAVELGNRVKTDLSKLAQIEPDVTSARKMAKDLLTGIDPRRPPSMETLKNLTTTLEKLEDTVVPLLLSVPYTFESIHELLETALASEKNQTVICNFREVFKMELKNISDSIQKGSNGNCLASPAEHETANKLDNEDNTAPMKQREVFVNLAYIRAALSMVNTDLQHIFKKCPDDTFSTVKPLGMVMG